MSKSPWLGRVHCRYCRQRIVPIKLPQSDDPVWVHSTTLDGYCQRPKQQLTLGDQTDYTKTAEPIMGERRA